MSDQGIVLTYCPNEFDGDGHFREWYDYHSILANVDKKPIWFMVSEYLDDDSCLKDKCLLDFVEYLKSCEIDPCVKLTEEYKKYGKGSEKFLYSFLTIRLQYFIDYLQRAFNLGLTVEVKL